MRNIEIRAQQFTETAKAMAFEFLAEKEAEGYSYVTWNSIGQLSHEASHQICEVCNRERGIGYIQLTEDGKAVCIFCEVIQLFNK